MRRRGWRTRLRNRYWSNDRCHPCCNWRNPAGRRRHRYKHQRRYWRGWYNGSFEQPPQVFTQPDCPVPQDEQDLNFKCTQHGKRPYQPYPFT